MEETSEELPKFSIGIDQKRLDSTSSKNKAELKKTRKLRVSQICRAAANFGRETFTGNRKDTNWSSTTIKGKISVFIVVFKFFYALLLSPNKPTKSGIFLLQ